MTDETAFINYHSGNVAGVELVNRYVSGNEYIVSEDGIWTWHDTKGGWMKFDGEGRLSEYGGASGRTARLAYDAASSTGVVTGVYDRNNRQVLAYGYEIAGGTKALISVTDLAGRSVRYGYNGQGLLSVATDALGYGATYYYNAQGRISRKIKADGEAVNISASESGYVTSVKDDSGVGYEYEYVFDYDNNKGVYASIRYASGRIEERWFSSDGIMIRKDINGTTVETSEFDTIERTSAMTDAQGNKTVTTANEFGQTVRTVNADGTSVSYGYDAAGNMVSKTSEQGVQTAYEYDDSGRITKLTEAKGLPEERTTEYVYDTSGNLTQSRIEGAGGGSNAGLVTAYEYDDYGNMAATVDPENHRTEFEYDVLGNMTRKLSFPQGVSGNPAVTSYAYDAKGRLTCTTDPLGLSATNYYDAAGNRIMSVIASPQGVAISSFTYDFNGNLTKTINQDSSIKTYEYNLDNKLVKQTDEEGKTTTYEYDFDGRLTQVTDALGNATRYEYANTSNSGCTSCSGGTNPTKITYPNGMVKQYEYDTRGRKTKETTIPSPLAGEGQGEGIISTFYKYDFSGNLIEQTDANGNLTKYEYDPLNRLSKVLSFPQGSSGNPAVTQYAYDVRDNLAELTDANNHTTHFEYDKNNRVTKETRPLGQETNYTYDALGNLAEKTDAKGQVTRYEYDAAGRLVRTQSFPNASVGNPDKTVTFTYDASGNLTGYDDGTSSATYTYDSLGHKTLERLNFGTFEHSFAYTYYKNGKKKSLTYPNGTTYQYAYDSANNLSSISIPGTGMITYAYQNNLPVAITYPGGTTRTTAYDGFGRLQSIVAKDPGQNEIMNYTYEYDNANNILSKRTEHGDYSYDYDTMYQLTSATSPFKTETFTYDPVGNRANATHNANNELLANDNASFEYDANGNLTRSVTLSEVEGTTTTYTYDNENRLVEVTLNTEQGTKNCRYYYDPFGRRLSKCINGATTYFLYSDEGLISEYDATGSEQARYGYTPDSMWGTNPVFQERGGEYYYYQNDHLGTPQKLIAGNGAVVWSATYDAFGKAMVDQHSTAENNLPFPGQYYDSETGLHYNWHRYYDSNVGRYAATDPIGFKGGVNFYRYVNNSPTRFIDPYGLKTNWSCIISCSINCILQHPGALSALIDIAIGGVSPDQNTNEIYELFKCIKKCPENCKDKDDCGKNDPDIPPPNITSLYPGLTLPALPPGPTVPLLPPPGGGTLPGGSVFGL